MNAYPGFVLCFRLVFRHALVVLGVYKQIQVIVRPSACVAGKDRERATWETHPWYEAQGAREKRDTTQPCCFHWFFLNAQKPWVCLSDMLFSHDINHHFDFFPRCLKRIQETHTQQVCSQRWHIWHIITYNDRYDMSLQHSETAQPQTKKTTGSGCKRRLLQGVGGGTQPSAVIMFPKNRLKKEHNKLKTQRLELKWTVSIFYCLSVFFVQCLLSRTN